MGEANRLRVNTASRFKEFILWGALFFLFLLIPQYARAEYIERYEVDAHIYPDAAVDVSENITYVFTEEKHGIYRCIPTVYNQGQEQFLKERYIEIAFEKATMDGGEVPYELTKKRHEVCVKVGDPDTTITGKHIYALSYTVRGALSYSEFGGAEFYWNATGNGWLAPIYEVVATVRADTGMLLRERACYRGEMGKESSCELILADDNSPRFKTTGLSPGEGLTLAQAVDRSKIKEVILMRLKRGPIIGGILLLLVPIIAFLLYRYKTRFKTEQPIIPQYEPYPELLPMYTGALFDGRLDPRDITAGIVFLAEQGFLKLTKTERKVLLLFSVDDYQITITKDPEMVQSAFEKRLLNILFAKMGTSLAVGNTISLSDLQGYVSDRAKIVVDMKALKSDIEHDLITKGFFEERSLVKKIQEPAGILLVAGLILCVIPGSFTVGIIVVVCSLFFLVSFHRRTAKGYEALDHLKGFKQFLSVTEKHRYIFHNAPEKNAEQFMEFLPYAIAFGVEEEWADVFKGITISNPSWYGGSSVTSFDAISLTRSLGGFGTALAGATQPSSSASSGGGFSGGGAGGGGGGSW